MVFQTSFGDIQRINVNNDIETYQYIMDSNIVPGQIAGDYILVLNSIIKLILTNFLLQLLNYSIPLKF